MDLLTSAKTSVSKVTSGTSADERSISVVASSVVVTVVKRKGTFVDIWMDFTKLLLYSFRLWFRLFIKTLNLSLFLKDKFSLQNGFVHLCKEFHFQCIQCHKCKRKIRQRCCKWRCRDSCEAKENIHQYLNIYNNTSTFHLWIAYSSFDT